MANPFDRFDPVPQPAGAPANPFDRFDAPPKPGVVEDVAKSGASGAARGVAGLVGLPGTVAGLARRGMDAAVDHTIGRAVNYAKTGSFAAPDLPPTTELMRQGSVAYVPGPDEAFSGEAITNYVAQVAPGIKYQPQTTAGEYARTVGEFAPGLLSPGTMAQKVIGGVLAPALVSETAGQATKGTAFEPYARVIGAIGGGVAGTLATRPTTAEAALSTGMRGVDDATMVQAGQLMQEAQARGVALTWPEAVAQATGGGGRGLTNMQRVVEGSQGGQDIMGGFMAQRPAQIAAAARNEFDNIAAQSQAPSTLGPAIGQAAQGTVDDVTGLINRTTRPAYAAAEAQRIGAARQAQLMGDPLYAQVFNEVRNNPALNRTIANLPDDSVGVVDMVQRRMREAADNAAILGQANSGNTIAANYEAARAAPVAAAEAATGSVAATATAPARVGTYEAARAQQAALRQQYLEPLMAGPIGRLAQRDLPTKRAIETLFPSNPLPGSAAEVVDAVGALTQRNPMAARQLVRAHVESVFNEATQALQSGANQFGGAGFVATLRGNPQQAENLSAAIRGVAGPDAARGFDTFLDVVAATGQRQRMGSPTAFNQELQDVLRRGGAVGEIANAAATGGIKIPGRIKEAYEQWRLGRNTSEIARLITDPNALPLFRRLAHEAPGSNRAQAIVARLTSMATQATQAYDNPVPALGNTGR